MEGMSLLRSQNLNPKSPKPKPQALDAKPRRSGSYTETWVPDTHLQQIDLDARFSNSSLPHAHAFV